MRGDGSAGVAIAIGAMSAAAWEIRNSASLAFTALLMRTVGFKNIVKVWTYAVYTCLLSNQSLIRDYLIWS